MCSRYRMEDRIWEALEEGFPEIAAEEREDRFRPFLSLRGDIRPSMSAPVLVQKRSEPAASLESCRSMPEMKSCSWGFPDIQGKGLIINARCETVLEKKLFSESVRNRRCLIPASGFYEWSQQKDPYFFTRKGAENRRSGLLLMAGFYRKWDGQDRFVILTTQANESIKEIHPRMPLILTAEEGRKWLAEDGSFVSLLKKRPEELDREPLGQLSLFL